MKPGIGGSWSIILAAGELLRIDANAPCTFLLALRMLPHCDITVQYSRLHTTRYCPFTMLNVGLK